MPYLVIILAYVFVFQSLDGFAFSLGPDGRLLYVSETVSIYLGLSQVSQLSHAGSLKAALKFSADGHHCLV